MAQSNVIRSLKQNARSLIKWTIKHNLILDQRGTLTTQLDLIYEVLCNYLSNTLDISCFNWIAHKWLPNRGHNAVS